MIEPPDHSEALLRAAMFEHLDRLVQTSPDGALASAAINTFTSRGGKQVDRSKMFRRLAAQAKPLALESSNYSNVPPVRIQQAPCLGAHKVEVGPSRRDRPGDVESASRYVSRLIHH